MSDEGIYGEAVTEAQGLRVMYPGSIATDRCQCPTCGEVFTTEGTSTGTWCLVVPPMTSTARGVSHQRLSV